MGISSGCGSLIENGDLQWVWIFNREWGSPYPTQPYQFNYQARDGLGNMHYRNEQGDQSGAVRGSYGYTDNQGLYRMVEYVADAGDYRVKISTNEPSTDGKQSPADVLLTAEQPPAGGYGAVSYGGGSNALRGGFQGTVGAQN
ncbi:cuticle protein 10.9 [Caerostris darwini]|uniref:Cuticle protein 10.9 n=1 Tax=Caerostris darwini TaxID=1538125 RepID=A0AAV4PC25_9ARAC|nr:cuticle protein 10.9 [Caerostris darwini]